MKKGYVLITGASSGIGKELASLYAQEGYPLILVSRNKEALQQVKMELGKDSIEIRTCDLYKEEQVFSLYQSIKNYNIEILINNAGAGKSGTLVELKEQTVLNLIHLNVSSMSLLTQLVAKGMVERGKGKILIVASTAAFGPDVGLNVYGPTKAYAYNFAQTLRGELGKTGVQVSCLCPGPTKTNWSKNAGRKESKTAMDAKTVARVAYKGLEKNKACIIPGFKNKVLYICSKIIPDSLIGKVTASFQKRLKK
ncbi:MAG: SDR family oxidoreductase [Firmicutes bacterium]|nr:SDR family oxidoreductase [Bacillota bacterium]